MSIKLWKMCMHDFAEGLWKRKSFFVLPVFMVFIACIRLQNQIETEVITGNYEGGSSMIDYWIYIIQGKIPYEYDPMAFWDVPIIWILIYTFLFISLTMYPTIDMQNWGYQLITRSGSRWLWWSAKCIWCVAHVLVYYAVCFGAVVIYALCNGGKFSLQPTEYVVARFCKESFMQCSDIRLIIIVFVLPVLVSVLLGIIEMILALRVNPILGFCTIFTILMLSAYKQNWLFIGNIGMPYRLDRISEGGLNSNMALIVSFIGIWLCCMIGYMLFKRVDIFEERNR